MPILPGLDDRHALQMNGEQQRVDAPGARRHDGHLQAALAGGEKGAGILEVIAFHMAGQHAAVRHGQAVAGLDHTDGVVRHDGELDELDLVLPGPQGHVQAGGQRVGLQAGFAVQRHDAAGRQLPVAAEQHEFLGHGADGIVRHDDEAEQAQRTFVQNQREQRRGGKNREPGVVGREEQGVHAKHWSEEAFTLALPTSGTHKDAYVAFSEPPKRNPGTRPG